MSVHSEDESTRLRSAAEKLLKRVKAFDIASLLAMSDEEYRRALDRLQQRDKEI